MPCSDAEPPIRKLHSHSRSCLSLLLVWTLIWGTAAPRVDAAGNWLIELSTALLSTPNTEQLDTPTDAVISRTRPTLNSGRVEGNLRVIKPEPFSIGAQTNVVGDLFLAGSPSIQSNQAEVVNEGGPASASYVVSISEVSGKIHTHTKSFAWPADFPSSVPAATGIRTITIRTKSDVAAIGDWQTVRDLNVTRAGLSIDVPPGNYGTFTVNGNSRLNFNVRFAWQNLSMPIFFPTDCKVIEVQKATSSHEQPATAGQYAE